MAHLKGWHSFRLVEALHQSDEMHYRFPSDLSSDDDEHDGHSSMSSSLPNVQSNPEQSGDQKLRRLCVSSNITPTGPNHHTDAEYDIDMVAHLVSIYDLDEDSRSLDIANEQCTTSMSHEHQQCSIEPMPSGCEITGLSADELRATGHTESHVNLIISLASRGSVGMLPTSWRTGLFFLPWRFFTHDDNTILRSHYTSAYAGEIAFTRMLDLGGWVRSGISVGLPPETRIEKFLKDYIRWTLKDAGLDKHTTLPIVKVVTAAKAIDDEKVLACATRSLTRLSARYHTALEEQATKSDMRTGRCNSRIPTLYALIAKHNKVALATLRPDDPSQTLLPTALFEFDDPLHDYWISLALAIIACHT
ncbi:hypothetical protein AMS68_005223 [Peltaster fructicola]|uniref:Uncharacterized protein n=1 Tax=Peltaster fructicola TaxID=286661 RepID=A0A6H0XYF1_9PEZI|nr:hypothetical protein AMS68_005223 [Peltaster fructicola]